MWTGVQWTGPLAVKLLECVTSAGLRFLEFSGVDSGPPEKMQKDRKGKRVQKAEKGQKTPMFKRFPGTEGRRPLSPNFVTPPFATTQQFVNNP